MQIVLNMRGPELVRQQVVLNWVSKARWLLVQGACVDFLHHDQLERLSWDCGRKRLASLQCC